MSKKMQSYFYTLGVGVFFGVAIFSAVMRSIGPVMDSESVEMKFLTFWAFLSPFVLVSLHGRISTISTAFLYSVAIGSAVIITAALFSGELLAQRILGLDGLVWSWSVVSRHLLLGVTLATGSIFLLRLFPSNKRSRT